MHDTPSPDDRAGLPPESLLLRQWIEQSGLAGRRVASAVTDLAQYLTTEYDFRLPESTLRNMLAGKQPALAPPWRLAAVGLICGGEPEELETAGRPDAAEELRTLRAARPEVMEIQGASGAPDTARLLVSIRKDMPPAERDQVRRTAQDFIELMVAMTPEERDLMMANAETFAELMRRHRVIEP
ncbi:hypothetical protein [Nonomuraea sp. LPB2021202275-12-8]|uniref:hypothetical protein n=1 Tax=Nonomuraea sp. LPB2021202275-12-8 TaxID=3120159 RepID=UPI00300CC839